MQSDVDEVERSPVVLSKGSILIRMRKLLAGRRWRGTHISFNVIRWHNGRRQLIVWHSVANNAYPGLRIIDK